MPAAVELDKYVCVADFERDALTRLSKAVADYYASGSDDEQTLKRNQEALRRFIIRPRVLHDVSQLNTSVRILLSPTIPTVRCLPFDKTMPYPIIIAPTAFQRMAMPDGETATIKAAGESNTIMICSTLSTSSIEEIAESAPPNTVYWYQLYVYKDRDLTRRLVERATKSGYSALVLTVDAPTMGRRRADERNGFQLPSHLRLANFEQELFAHTREGAVGSSGFSAYSLSLFDMSLQWSDLNWLIDISTLPVIVKGIMRFDDARRAVACGVAGIVVSNHGGRQLDHCAATIEALPEVVNAVNGLCPVFIDGGFRSGADILKAVALGAEAVLIGRPIVYGLAIAGKNGVRKVIELLRTELDYALRLSGYSSVEEIRRELRTNCDPLVVHENYFANSPFQPMAIRASNKSKI